MMLMDSLKVDLLVLVKDFLLEFWKDLLLGQVWVIWMGYLKVDLLAQELVILLDFWKVA